MGKKLVKQQHLLHTFPQYGELWLTNDCDQLVSLGHPGKFQRVLLRHRSDVSQRRPTKLCTMFGHLLGWSLYIRFWGLLPRSGILQGAKFTLHPSLVFSYIANITARPSSSGHQPNFAAWYKEWNYGTFAKGTTYIRQGGHHVGHWPTF